MCFVLWVRGVFFCVTVLASCKNVYICKKWFSIVFCLGPKIHFLSNKHSHNVQTNRSHCAWPNTHTLTVSLLEHITVRGDRTGALCKCHGPRALPPSLLDGIKWIEVKTISSRSKINLSFKRDLQLGVQGPAGGQGFQEPAAINLLSTAALTWKCSF